MRYFWIIFWSLIALGWSLISFQWLRKSVESIHPLADGQMPTFMGLHLRRLVMFVAAGGLLYLALRTEPLAAIAMVLVITIATWLQVIRFSRQKSERTEGESFWM